MGKVKMSLQERSWTMYDVGVSAFSMLLTAIIPTYAQSLGTGMGLAEETTLAHWGFVQSFATLFVALLAPILGAMADHRGKKKMFFSFFLVLSVASLLCMALFESYYALLILNVVAGVGYAASNIVYDAFLVDVTDDSRMDYVSSFGFAIGYIGSCAPFILSIALIMFKPFGLEGAAPVKLSFALNAVWWTLFSLPFMRNVKQKYCCESTAKNIVGDAFRKVFSSFKIILKTKHLGLFLLAYFFYIDGVDTIIKMSAIYGNTVGIDTTQMILALLGTQIVAFPSVLIFAKISNRFSTRLVLKIAIGVYTAVCVFAYFLRFAWQFWLMALVVGLVQGTIQVLSRSYYGKLIPDKTRSNEYFGFFNILGRYAAVLGPFLMSLTTLITGNSQAGVLSIAILFIAGYIVLSRVPDVPKDGAPGENK